MKPESSQTARHFLLPVILTILTIVLGLISFHAVFPEYSFWRKLYFTFQLFSMESGDRFYEHGSQPFGISIIFNIARFLAIATLIVTIAIAILSVLRYRYFMSRIKHMNGHTILCGVGDIGRAFAENLAEKSRLVILEKNAENENLQKLKKAGARIIGANALDTMVLNRIGIHRAKYLLAATGDDFDNLTIINYAFEQLKTLEHAEGRIFLVASILSRNLKMSVLEEWKRRIDPNESILRKRISGFYEAVIKIKAQGGSGPDADRMQHEMAEARQQLTAYDPSAEPVKGAFGIVKLSNVNQLAARYIFLQYPPDRFRSITNTADPEVKVLILGWSEIGEELFKLCVQNCHFINGEKTRITLVYPDSEQIESKFSSRFKHVNQVVDFQPIKQNPLYMTSRSLVDHNLTRPDVVYICSREDLYQVSYCTKARELFGESVAIVRPFYRNMVLWKDESISNLFSFNILEKVCTIAHLVGESLDKRAVTVHNLWLKQAISDYVKLAEKALGSAAAIPEPKPTLVPWYLLDEEIRDDNRSVVDHMNIKLRSAGQLKDPDYYECPERAKIEYGFLDDPGLVEMLAEMEHRRWMANKYLYGWEYGQVRSVLLREHENLKDYHELDEGTKDYDRDQVQKIKEIIK